MLSRSLFTLLLLLGIVTTTHSQITKGHQIIIDRGLQVQGLVSRLPSDVFHLSTYSNANYNTIHWEWDSRPAEMGAAPGFPWARWIRDMSEMPPRAGEEPYLSQLVMIQLGDEWELNNDTLRTQLVDWFNAVRANWPNTILFHNNYGGQVGDAQLGDFVTRAQPDMLCFDAYPFRRDGSGNKYQTLVNWYSDLRRYRQHAKGANIPLGTYLQTYSSVSENVSAPSESELHLQHSAALAFNCKALIDFSYNMGSSALFTNVAGGDNAPNSLYYEKANAALRARNFGKALVRLKPIDDEYFPDLRTTGMLFIRGRNDVGTLNPFPISFYAGPSGTDAYTDWVFQRNDAFLTGWNVTNTGTKNNGYPGDVIISWFKPLDESFDGPEHTNEIYMMVVNGLSDLTGTPAQCAQEIVLNFTSSLTAIEALNPLTGIVEVQQLSLVNGARRLTLNLDGGHAALFKFSDGAPFVGAQLTGPPVITQQPANKTSVAGANATFTARAAGASVLKYQWQFNGMNIAGATTSTVARTNVQNSDIGFYSVIVSNTFGSVTSAPAFLTIISPSTLLYEPFDYSTVGGPVNSNTPSNWVTGGSGTNDLNVASGNLSYPGLLAPIGNSVTNGGVGLAMRRLFGTPVSSGKLFFSALFRINDLGYGAGKWNGASTQAGALTANDNSSFRLQVLVRSNSPTTYVFGVQKGGTGSSSTFSTNQFQAGETVLLVGRYDFDASPNTVTLWANPAPSSLGAEEPPSGFISTNTGPDGFIIDRFNIRQNTVTTLPAAMQWDELRVGTQWSDVTSPRAPVQIESFELLPGGQLQIAATGDRGNVTLETSTNLVNWTEVTTLSNDYGNFEYSGGQTNSAQRFYRLKLAP